MPATLPGRLKLAGQVAVRRRRDRSPPATTSDRPGSPPPARSPPVSDATGRTAAATGVRSLPCSVAASAEPAIVADQSARLRLPAGHRHRAIGGERGGVAVDRRVQRPASGCPADRDLTHRRERRQVGEPQRGVHASPLAGQRIGIGGRTAGGAARRAPADQAHPIGRRPGSSADRRRAGRRSGPGTCSPVTSPSSRSCPASPAMSAVNAVDADAGGAQRVDVQAAGRHPG